MYQKMKGYFDSKPKVYAQIQPQKSIGKKNLIHACYRYIFSHHHTRSLLLVSRKHSTHLLQ